METNTKSIIFLPTLQDMFVMTPKNWDDKDASIRESEMKKVVMEAANRTYCTYRSTLSRYYRSVMFDEERLSHPPDGVAHYVWAQLCSFFHLKNVRSICFYSYSQNYN